MLSWDSEDIEFLSFAFFEEDSLIPFVLLTAVPAVVVIFVVVSYVVV